MKTKHWILIFSALAAGCILLCILLYGHGEAKQFANVYSNGVFVRQIPLETDGEYRIDSDGEWNILTVSEGKISVTEASCPSQDCVHRGAADHGAPIVCLPNRLVIEFSDGGGMDAIIG